MGTNWNHIGKAGRAKHAAQRLADRYGIELPRKALKRLAAYLRRRSPNVIPGPGMLAPDASRARMVSRINRRQEVWLLHPAVLGLAELPGDGDSRRVREGHQRRHGDARGWIKVVYDRHKGRIATVLTGADRYEV